MSVSRKRHVGDHYTCSTCQGTGRLQLSDIYQEVLDNVTTLQQAHGVTTLRMLQVSLPRVSKPTLIGRLLFLRQKGFIETAEDLLHGTYYLVTGTSFVVRRAVRKTRS